jgi:O-antigen biosynthesis protein
MLGEFGIDSIREGEPHKCEMLRWHIESAFRAGLAGTVVFSFTDDWFRGGQQIEDWAFGLTDRARRPKASLEVVKNLYEAAPYLPLSRYPKVSVVVASYNGARTLKSCLNSLAHLNYPNYEVILVDDGSTDDTRSIAQVYPNVRHISQANLGLSAARNTGIAAATGEIVAFTDSDCRADEDWLYYLVQELLTGDFIGVGGHNFLPPDDSPLAAAVLVSPGGPAHVMITDREAEHIPGCNMAFYKWALEEIRGFDPVFRKAGDDVDVCWRLRERGYKIGFSSAGFVWHYRRSSVAAYLKQQGGYGEAEALLGYKHPEYFNTFGGGIWRGRIYTDSKYALTIGRPIIYHGIFGSGFFQKLYAPSPAFRLMLFTSLEYQVLVTLPLLVLSPTFTNLFPVAIASLIVSTGICIAAAAQAELPKPQRRLWSRPLIALLFFLQPMVRGWSRYKWRLQVRSEPKEQEAAKAEPVGTLDHVEFWSERWLDRFTFLDRTIAALEQAGWQTKVDTGWSNYDVEIFGSRWSRLRLITVAEYLAAGRTMLRCRLHAYWSLRAKVVFWTMTGAEVLAVGIFAEVEPWVWMIFLSLPILAWYLEHERQQLQRHITGLLDGIAATQEIVRVPAAAK